MASFSFGTEVPSNTEKSKPVDLSYDERSALSFLLYQYDESLGFEGLTEESYEEFAEWRAALHKKLDG